MPTSNLQTFVDDQLQKCSHDLYAETIAMVDRYVLARVLKHTRGNQSQAAKLLGITRGSLRNKLRSLHIAVDAIVTVDEDADGRYAEAQPAS